MPRGSLEQDTGREAFGLLGGFDSGHFNADINLKWWNGVWNDYFSKRRTIALNIYLLLASIPNQKYTVLLKTKKRFRPFDGKTWSQIWGTASSCLTKNYIISWWHMRKSTKLYLFILDPFQIALNCEEGFPVCTLLYSSTTYCIELNTIF